MAPDLAFIDEGGERLKLFTDRVAGLSRAGSYCHCPNIGWLRAGQCN